MHNCHRCECKHEHIKFCSCCQKPFCQDCGKEWAEPCNQSHYYPWYVGPSITTYTATVDSTPLVTWGQTTTTNCSHTTS